MTESIWFPQSRHVTAIEDEMRNHKQKIQRVRTDVVYWRAIETGRPESPSHSMNDSSNFPALHLFEYTPRTTLAERFPVLTCVAISCTLLASAVMAEIELLRGSGYFWR
jgi:hypothetical protein